MHEECRELEALQGRHVAFAQCKGERLRVNTDVVALGRKNKDIHSDCITKIGKRPRDRDLQNIERGGECDRKGRGADSLIMCRARGVLDGLIEK